MSICSARPSGKRLGIVVGVVNRLGVTEFGEVAFLKRVHIRTRHFNILTHLSRTHLQPNQMRPVALYILAVIESGTFLP